MKRKSRKVTRQKLRKTLKRRKSKKRMSIKRGGDIINSVQQILRKVGILRQEAGDFDDQHQPQHQDQLEGLSGQELLDTMRKLRGAQDGTISVAAASKFGKDLMIARRIGACTDDIITTLFKNYDVETIKKLSMSMILSYPLQLNLQEYLPKNMIGDHGDLYSWLLLHKGSANVHTVSTTTPKTKPDLTLHNFIETINTILKKYPDIDVRNENTINLMITDVLKKIYYIDELHKPNALATMGGGGIPEDVDEGYNVMSLAVRLTTLALLYAYCTVKINAKLWVWAGDSGPTVTITNSIGDPKSFPKEFEDFWKGKIQFIINTVFGKQRDKYNQYVDEKITEYEHNEPELRAARENDLQLVREGKSPQTKSMQRVERDVSRGRFYSNPNHRYGPEDKAAFRDAQSVYEQSRRADTSHQVFNQTQGFGV